MTEIVAAMPGILAVGMGRLAQQKRQTVQLECLPLLSRLLHRAWCHQAHAASTCSNPFLQGHADVTKAGTKGGGKEPPAIPHMANDTSSTQLGSSAGSSWAADASEHQQSVPCSATPAQHLPPT